MEVTFLQSPCHFFLRSRGHFSPLDGYFYHMYIFLFFIRNIDKLDSSFCHASVSFLTIGKMSKWKLWPDLFSSLQMWATRFPHNICELATIVLLISNDVSSHALNTAIVSTTVSRSVNGGSKSFFSRWSHLASDGCFLVDLTAWRTRCVGN